MYIKKIVNDREQYMVPYEEPEETNKDLLSKTLAPGIYYPGIVGGMFTPPMVIYQLPTSQPSEKIVPFTTGTPKEIIDFCNTFFTPRCKDIYMKLGIAHKLGVLLYGQQGTGKTTIVNSIARALIENNQAIVLDIAKTDAGKLPKILEDTRANNPNSLLVVIMDEFENDVKYYEPTLLKMLDGNLAVDNVLYLATTNYISKIPARIKQRPSRFRIVREIKAMPFDVYKEFAVQKLAPFNNNAGLNVEQIAHDAEEAACTIDELKHIIVDLVTSETTFKQSLDVVRVAITEESEYS